MEKRSILTATNILFITVVMIITASLFFDVPRSYAEQYFGGSPVMTGLLYLSLVVFTTVVAPFAGLPLSPAVSIIIGPFMTTVYSVIGWTIGASIAFWIARRLARPLLSRFINMEKLEKYESYIPEKHLFMWLVFLRFIIPVDILSYAIGLTKRIQFPMYLITTFIGVIPFSFVWAYGGYALIEQNHTLFTVVASVGLVLFFSSIVFYYTRRRAREISKPKA